MRHFSSLSIVLNVFGTCEVRRMKRALGPVYMEAGLARLARQPGKRDEFLLCLYEKIPSRLPGQFCCFDIDLTVVKNSLRRYL